MDNASPVGENGENGDAEDPVTFTNAIKMLSQMCVKLGEQNVKTPAAVKIRNEVCQELADFIEVIQGLRRISRNDFAAILKPTLYEVIEDIKDEIKAEIKVEIKALDDTMKETMKEKTYAQATTSKPSPSPKAPNVHEQRTTT
jgi:hypothetical protein